MKLTNKCLKDFEKWWIENRSFDVWTTNNDKYNIDDFFCLNFSMQYGVLIDFFDSVGLEIQIYVGQFGGWDIVIYNESDNKYVHKKDSLNDNTVETRQEAREQSIIKANEIYNKQ